MSPLKGSNRLNTAARPLAFCAVFAMGLNVIAGCQGMPKPGESRPIAGWTNEDRPSRFGAGRFQPEPKLLPVTHFTSAQLQESSGAFEGAVAQYRQAIALNHNFVAAYERLGVLLDRLARYPEAENVWNRVIAIAPNRPSIHNNRGFHYLLQKRYTQAAESFSEALMIDPSFDRARVNLGIAIT